MVRKTLQSGQNTSDPEELFKLAQEIRAELEDKSEQIKNIETERDRLIRNLENQLSAARARQGKIHEDELLASIENLRKKAEDEIKAIKNKP